AARASISAMKKALKQHTQSQSDRLERAMTGGRTWQAADWRAFFLQHPLMQRLTRSVLFEHVDTNTCFFVTEEGECLDAELEPVELDGTVRIPHPITLDDDVLEIWREIFADAEIVQPFPQLHRPCYPLPASDDARPFFEALDGATGVPPLRMVGELDRAGFERGEAEDGGMV